ncbi:SDR family NAD(P)-dependent oxidoreductase [Anaerosporobacter sp.]|uniref:SDR family NAD(P)-dependent oxidoreductase n=1 Tax=Anaerosporobacter sp. TaxID=1872529 RepID=UPI00286EC0A9|nr:SDR family NAD(P)-dependent oxidoreductase [Anaerosporobacter sp.]
MKKIILVTGASSGIGKVTALALAKQGHTVILHGRNPEKTKKAFNEIKKESNNSNLDMITADLSLLSEVRKFADAIKTKYDHLDVLINNAGGQFGSVREETSEGHEKTMAINLLSPFLLTHLLLDLLHKSPSARVVTVSSESYRQGGKPFLGDIELKENYSMAKAYGLSKLYIYWIMLQFVKQTKDKFHNITFNTVEPGSANTELGRISTQEKMMKIIYYLWQPMMWSIEKAAATSIYMATSNEVEGITGKFYGKSKEKNIKSKFRSEADEKAVWDYCMKVCEPYMK